MTGASTYGDPAAFRRALTDRLRNMAKTSKWTLPQLQRQIAYDRLLERLYLVDDDWIVKGATALLARDIGVRGSLDVDVYREAASEVAEADLRAAAANDIRDWFRFGLGPVRTVDADTPGVRIPVVTYIGVTVWVEFHVDLVGSDLRMTAEPEDVPPLARVLMPDFEQHGYRAYPIVDHVADKIAATFERHGDTGAPSTRYRDLVDLVAIVGEASIDADAQSTALRSEAERRGLTLPATFDVPDRPLWEAGYAAEAARSLLPMARTLDEALNFIRPFTDPLLTGTASGAWDSRAHEWHTSRAP